MTVLEVWALVCLAFWIGLAMDRLRAWPREAELPAVETGSRTRQDSRVVAIVPARNEEATLVRTLPSLLLQESLDLVVVADDGSEDATYEVAARVAASASGATAIRLITVPSPPAGWSGKVHAISFATAEMKAGGADRGDSENDWWLFTDADVELRPMTVKALLRRAESREQGGPFDLVSVMARLHTGSFWERLLVPPFVFFFQLLYPFRRVRDSRSRVAAAAGGCILVRRAIYEAAGGHAAIHDALIDDVALAKLVKENGGRVWLGLDQRVRSIRPYHRLRDLWQMVSRSAFVQLGYRFDLLLLAILGLGLFVMGPPLLAGAAAIMVSAGSLSFPVLARVSLLAGLAWVLQALALRPAVLHHRAPVPFSFSLPLAGALFGLMTLSSAWDHISGRGQRWKGRSYLESDGPSPE
jgi:hopene-associated glycosyltransferase HpnB